MNAVMHRPKKGARSRLGSALPAAWIGPFVALLLLMLLLLFTGGSARGDLYLLIVQRPLAALFLAYGLWGFRAEHFSANRFLFMMLGAIMLLTLAHLFPLPPSVWASLPGRAEVVIFADATGTNDVWRPLTMRQWTTWNAFYAEVTVAAVLVLSARLDRDDRYRLVPVILALGAAFVLLGVLQLMSGGDSALYYYPVSNVGSAIGFLANRNHTAVFLASLYPLLAAFAATADTFGGRSARRASSFGARSARTAIAIAAGIALIPMLLVVGSRAGLVLGAIAITLSLILYRACLPVDERKLIRPLVVVAGLALSAVVALIAIYAARAEAIERFFGAGAQDELRFQVWPVIVEITQKYFPVGSGIGSFVEAYGLDEPRWLLSRNYLNHAHNDWLEVAMTAGLPGAILLLTAVIGWAVASYRVLRADNAVRRDVMMGRAGAINILLLGLASIGDYPLRTPFLAAYFVICAVWLAAGARNAREPLPQLRGHVGRAAAQQ